MPDETINFWVRANELFEKICQGFDLVWQKRKRVLTTQLLVIFILKAVLSRGKQGYNSSLIQLWETCSEKGITLPQINSVAASSLCEARQKLPEEIFKHLNTALIAHWHHHKKMPTWQGHKVFGIDGSKLNVPRGLILSGYKVTNREGRHYPQGTLSCLYNLQEQIVYDVEFVPHRDERACALEHLNHLNPGDIVIFDRGYFSYYMFFKILALQLNAVFRLQEGNVNKKVETFWKSEKMEEIIEYSPSGAVKSELKKRGYTGDMKPIKMRLIKYILGNETYVCATTLTGELYPPDCFVDLYHGRWGMEELYKISKNFIDVEDFHAQTERGVKHEIYGHVLLLNLARMFEYDAKNKLPTNQKSDELSGSAIDTQNTSSVKKLQPHAVKKINFKNCLLIVGRHLENFILAPKELIHTWLEKILSSISRVRQKIRPDRHYPRISHKPRSRWSSYREPVYA